MVTDKVSIRVSADPEHIEWIEEQIKTGRFASKSHAYRFAISELIRLDAIREKLKKSS